MSPPRKTPGILAAATALGLSAYAGAGQGPSDPALARPLRGCDVVWVTICSLRADALGAYGAVNQTSPNLDRLARRGILFERYLAVAPWTRPSMAAMVTGLYPLSLQVEEAVEGAVRPRRSLPLVPKRCQTLAERFREAGYVTLGLTANPNVNAVLQFDQGFDDYQDTRLLWRDGYGADKVPADRLTAQLLEKVASLEGGRPLFAHLVLVDVHEPYSTEVLGLGYDGIGLLGSRDRLLYDLNLRFVDTVLAQFLSRLSELRPDAPLLVINADHGQAFGAVRLRDRGHGRFVYNSTLWVPFLLHHPRLERHARRIPRAVELVDCLPTVLDLVGLPVPDREAVDGRSLVPWITEGNPEPVRPYFVIQTQFAGVDKDAVIERDWKLIVDWAAGASDPAIELYHLRMDFRERRNLAGRNSDLEARLLRRLRSWERERRRRRVISDEAAEMTPGEKEALRTLGYLDE